MKKIFLSIIMLFVVAGCTDAVQMGSYNPEFEDGILDRIKINFFQKDKKFIEVLEPNVDDEKRQKEKQQVEDSEYERYKYLYTPAVKF